MKWRESTLSRHTRTGTCSMDELLAALGIVQIPGEEIKVWLSAPYEEAPQHLTVQITYEELDEGRT